jgi:hypothetical protein
MSAFNFFDDQAFFETYDAVATSIFARIPPLNSLITVFIEGSGVRPSTGDAKTWSIMFTIKRGVSAPTLSAVTSIFTAVSDAGASAWLLAPAVNGNSVEVRVTGQATATILWNFKITAVTSSQ